MTSPLRRIPAGSALGSLASVALPSEPTMIAYRTKGYLASSPLVPPKAIHAFQQSSFELGAEGQSPFVTRDLPDPTLCLSRHNRTMKVDLLELRGIFLQVLLHLGATTQMGPTIMGISRRRGEWNVAQNIQDF